MFNLSGSELIFLVLIALVVLGPDKLPEAMRKAGKVYADFKRMTSGFQSEMKSVLDEPMRELRETAELAKKAAMFDPNQLDIKPTSAAKPTPKAAVKPVSAVMADATTASIAAVPVTTADSLDAAANSTPAAGAASASGEGGDATNRRLASTHATSAVVASGDMVRPVRDEPMPSVDEEPMPSVDDEPMPAGDAHDVAHVDGTPIDGVPAE